MTQEQNIDELVKAKLEAANQEIPEARQVPLTAALEVAYRAKRELLRAYPVIEADAHEFTVDRVLDNFITVAATGVLTASARYLDLLPVGNPVSTAVHELSATELRTARAEWVAADQRIAPEMRPIVASALSAEPGTAEHLHANARLSSASNGLVPRDIALLAEFSDVGGNSRVAKSERAREQLRDHLGKFAEEGKGSHFLAKVNGAIFSLVSRVVGGSDKKGYAQVYITQDSPETGLKKGDIVKVKQNNFEVYNAELTNDQLEKAGVDLSKVKTDILDGNAQDIAELLATKSAAPDGWTQISLGKFTTADGYTAEMSGNKGEMLVKDSNGNPVPGLESAEWPDIQKTLTSLAKKTPEYTLVSKPAKDLAPGDKVNVNGKEQTVKAVSKPYKQVQKMDGTHKGTYTKSGTKMQVDIQFVDDQGKTTVKSWWPTTTVNTSTPSKPATQNGNANEDLKNMTPAELKAEVERIKGLLNSEAVLKGTNGTYRVYVDTDGVSHPIPKNFPQDLYQRMLDGQKALGQTPGDVKPASPLEDMTPEQLKAEVARIQGLVDAEMKRTETPSVYTYTDTDGNKHVVPKHISPALYQQMLDAQKMLDAQGSKNEAPAYSLPAPKNTPSNKQLDMIKSMLNERDMTDAQRQEFMDQLAKADKYGISPLFSVLKDLPKRKPALTEDTDPLNQSDDQAIAELKKAIAHYDLDGALRRSIDEQAANGTVDTGALRKALENNWLFNADMAAAKSSVDPENGNAIARISRFGSAVSKVSTGMTTSEKADKVLENYKANQKKFNDNLVALGNAQKDMPASPSISEHDAAVLNIINAIKQYDHNGTVANKILEGKLVDGPNIVDALAKVGADENGNNNFGELYGNAAAGHGDDQAVTDIINAAYALPKAPEGYTTEILKRRLSNYDNPNQDLAKLIDSGADSKAILEWLNTNGGPAWEHSKHDYETRGYVELPNKVQKANWARFANLLEAIDSHQPVSTEQPQPEQPAQAESSQPKDLSKFKYVKALGGTNGGGVYEDPETGKQYAVKVAKSQDHADNEALASAIYKAAGIYATDVSVGTMNGKIVTYSPMIEGFKEDFKSHLHDSGYLRLFQSGYAVDALLANWDVVGLDYDNVGSDANGFPIRVDQGGALMYRAQGAPKGSSFGDTVPELDTFTDKFSTRPSAKVFSKMSQNQITGSALYLTKDLTPEVLDGLVDQYITDPKTASMLKDKLTKRRQFIIDKLAPTPVTAPAENKDASKNNYDLANEADADEVAKSLMTELPDGYTAEPSNTVDSAVGQILIKNPQGETSMMISTDPEDHSKYAVGDFAGGWKLLKYDNLDDAVAYVLANTPASHWLKLSDGTPAKPGTKVSHPEFGNLTITKFKQGNYVFAKPENGGKDKIISVNKLTAAKAIEPAPKVETPAVEPSAPVETPAATVTSGSKLSDGTPVTVGMVVKHGKHGLGTIVSQKNDNYVVVKSNETGKSNLLSVGKLTTVKSDNNPTPAPQVETPEAIDNTPLDDIAKELGGDWTVNHTGDVSTLDSEKNKVTVSQNSETNQWVISKTGKSDKVFDDYDQALAYLKQRYATKPAVVETPKEEPAAAPAPATGAYALPGQFSFNFTDMPGSYTDEHVAAPTSTKEQTLQDSEGVWMKPGAIVTDAEGKKGVYINQTNAWMDNATVPKMKIVWEDGKQTSYTEPSSVTSTNQYIANTTAAYSYSKLSPLDFMKHSETLPDEPTKIHHNFTDANGKAITYKQIVVDKNGDYGVVISSQPNGYINVAFPDGNKLRKHDALNGTDKQYTLSDYTIKGAQSAYKSYVGPGNSSFPEIKSFGKKVSKTSESKETGASGSKKYSIPVNPAGEKVQVQTPLNWNESDFASIPSLEQALAKVIDPANPNAGIAGASIALDSDSIEDLDLRILGAVLEDGSNGYVMKYKLTSWAGDALSNQILQMIEANDSRVTKVNSLQVPYGKVVDGKLSYKPSKNLTPGQGYSNSNGETFIITMDDGTKITFMRADKPSGSYTGSKKIDSNSAKSFHNKVMIMAPATATPDSIAQALSTAGIQDTRPSTKEDARVLIENRLMSILAGQVNPATNAKGEARKALLAQIEKDWGITTANVTLTTGAAGRVEMRLDAESAKRIAEKTKVGILAHNLYANEAWAKRPGETPEQYRDRMADWVASRIATPQGGLLSTTTRWSEGIPGTGGMSSNQDVLTGGADYVFTTPKPPTTKMAPRHEGYGTKGSDLVPGLYFDAERLFQRLDFWANTTDQFGKRTGKDPIGAVQPWGYEVMFKHRVSYDDAKAIMVLDEDYRTRIITKLRQQGVNELGGRPLEAVIHTEASYAAATKTTE